MEKQESTKQQQEQKRREKYLVGQKGMTSNPYNPLNGEYQVGERA